MWTGRSRTLGFPFTAIVGQEALKLALILSAVHAGVGGVLIRGRKGTAKSTCARALFHLLPMIQVVKDCHYGCDPHAPESSLCRDCQSRRKRGIALVPAWTRVPFVTLPVNATEDNLVGGIDLEATLKAGKRHFRPGLLAKVHRGILYVDEVNLLDNHLVDLITDAAATGVNLVEREGISYVHPSEFALVGTMNPEEGELRPQILDRFGLCVGAEDITEVDQRVAVMERREAFEMDPVAFCDTWKQEQERERIRIKQAIRMFGRVRVTEQRTNRIVQLCWDAGIAGHRGDIVICRAARALASYRGRTEVEDHDVEIALLLAMPHRMRPRDPDGSSRMQEHEMHPWKSKDVYSLDENGKPTFRRTGMRSCAGQEPVGHQRRVDLVRKDDTDRQGKRTGPADDQGGHRDETSQPSCSSWEERVFEVGKPISIELADIRKERGHPQRRSSGRRRPCRTTPQRGRYVRSTMNRGGRDIALDATLRAAAPHQAYRIKGSLAIRICSQDIREKIRERMTSSLLVFAVDASGSMGTRLMTETKGAILYLLLEAYQKRDRVCLVAFRGNGSELLLPPTNSVQLAKKRLADLPTGGRTPLTAGLLHGYKIALQQFHRNQEAVPLLVLITDGRANVGADPKRSYAFQNTIRIYEELYALADTIRCETWLKSLVIDAEEKKMHTHGMARRIAERMGAKYVLPAEFHSTNIVNAVRKELLP